MVTIRGRYCSLSWLTGEHPTIVTEFIPPSPFSCFIASRGTPVVPSRLPQHPPQPPGALPQNGSAQSFATGFADQPVILARLKFHYLPTRTYAPYAENAQAWEPSSPPWSVDAPAADINLFKAFNVHSGMVVGEPTIATISPESLQHYPVALMTEVGYLDLTPPEAEALREWLLRGGFLIIDDFHGPDEWHHLLHTELPKVFPELHREPHNLRSGEDACFELDGKRFSIRDIPPAHAIFEIPYKITDVPPVIPGLRALTAYRCYETSETQSEIKGLFHPAGRIMIVINHNMDIGDSWEHAFDPDYSNMLHPYVKPAFHLGINYLFYGLTH